jgi:hypothetical protein
VEPRHRLRLAVNILNGSTLFGIVVASAGRARLARGPEGLLLGSGYRLRVPVAPAFCVGNVILTRHGHLAPGRLLTHEARHATQYAWCAGLVMIPLYFIAAGASWVLTGDFAARNVFERRAGLADGGYADRALRSAFARFGRKAASGGGLSA